MTYLSAIHDAADPAHTAGEMKRDESGYNEQAQHAGTLLPLGRLHFRKQTHQVLTLALQTAASPNQSQSARNANAQRAGNTVRGGKRPAPGTKTPGAFLNNAKRWPVYGRTSGMRCVIARAERPWMALAPFPSDHIPFAGSNLQLRCPSAPYPNLPQKFSSSLYSDEKNLSFQTGF